MMKTPIQHHGIFLLTSLLFFLLSPEIRIVGAQTPPENEQYPNYARFSPSMAIIIVVLIAALFFMGFFSIYIRHCSDSSGAAGSIRRALSIAARRAAARGLDQSVIETFPTFSYSEVKDHKIGNGALECAVCLNEFQDDETLRLLPKCDHVFHPECIDAWLESHVTCPVCRANLAPQQGDDQPVVQESEPAGEVQIPEAAVTNNNVSIRDEIVIQVENEAQLQEQGAAPVKRSSSFEYPTRPPRSWSIRRPSVFGFGRFRSHSTGHSLVQPGENLDRFTLRLPKEVRKEVLDRAALNRTGSSAATLPRERSSRRGYRTGGGEGSGRSGRFYGRIERSDREAKSDRWAFFTRGLSMRSTRVVAEAGESSGGGVGGGAPPVVKMPSFKCLEPKADDESGLISSDHQGKPPV